MLIPASKATFMISLTGSPFIVLPKVSPAIVKNVQPIHETTRHVHPPREKRETRSPLGPSLRKIMFFWSNSVFTTADMLEELVELVRFVRKEVEDYTCGLHNSARDSLGKL